MSTVGAGAWGRLSVFESPWSVVVGVLASAAAGVLLWWLPWALRVTLVEVRWWIESAGYWIRPYDMLADARRWRWRPRQRCQFAQGGYVRARDGSDTVPFVLSPGEEIITRERAEALGLGAAWDAEERRKGGSG